VTDLLDPFTLRGRTFRNRLWVPAMCMYSVEARDGVPTDFHLAHYASRVAGGFGLVLSEATAVVPEGRISPYDTGLWSDAHGAAWARVAGGVLTCGGRCPREMRPLGCRIFPLTPYRKKGGTLAVRVDRRAFAMCPLAPAGVRALDPAFVKAVLSALELIDQTPEGREFIDAWIRAERIFREVAL